MEEYGTIFCGNGSISSGPIFSNALDVIWTLVIAQPFQISYPFRANYLYSDR